MTLEEQNKNMREIIDRFIVKSNGLSRWVRMDFGQNIPQDLKDQLISLYDFQCEVEDSLDKYSY